MITSSSIEMIFLLHDTSTTEIYTYLHTLSLPDALPILARLQRQGERHAAGLATAEGKALRFGAAVEAAGEAGERQAVAELGLARSEEQTSELQPKMRNSYAVFCLKKKQDKQKNKNEKEHVTNE